MGFANESEMDIASATSSHVNPSQECSEESSQDFRKHKTPDTAEMDESSKRIRLEEGNESLDPAEADESSKSFDYEEKDETLECLKNLCESVAEPQSEEPQVEGEKPSKKKRKKTKDVKAKTKPKKTHMRKNIRDILKDNELEAETRAAQQREIERVQRLQQLQQRPNDGEIDGNNPATTLVEDLQALAKELEDNSLSPEIPINFDDDEQIKEESPFITSIKVYPLLLPLCAVFISPLFLQEEFPTEATEKKDVEDVICLSSDEEETPPKKVNVVPAPVSKSFVSCEDDDDDDVVILSGLFF